MKKFLKTKGAMKTAPQKAVRAGERIAGALGAGYLSNKVIGTSKIDKKYHGLIFLGLGLAGEIFVDQQDVNAIAQGVTVAGGQMLVANNLLPNEKASFGLAGPEDVIAAEADALAGWQDAYGNRYPLDGTPEYDLPMLDDESGVGYLDDETEDVDFEMAGIDEEDEDDEAY